MWPTLKGLRFLVGDEAALVRASIGMMIDSIVAEGRDDAPQDIIGIDWYDQWDWQQRCWLLDEITRSLLTPHPPPPPAAMWEATIDAIFCNIFDLACLEIDDPAPVHATKTWRQSVIDAFRCQRGHQPCIRPDQRDPGSWQSVITQLADGILGSRMYQRAESFRDQEISATHRFLRSRGLPDDFLEQIPPLCSIDQTQLSIDRIQSLIF
jgi:hypothetical protein